MRVSIKGSHGEKKNKTTEDNNNVSAMAGYDVIDLKIETGV